MKPILLTCIFLIMGFVTQAQPAGFDYEAAWKRTETLSREQRPESVLKEVEKIYEAARKEKKNDQLLRAISYRTSAQLESAVSPEEALTALRKDAETLPFPANQAVRSLLGDTYGDYLQSNYWRFMNRTDVSQDESDDIATWSLSRLITEMVSCYLNSLDRASELQRIPANDFLPSHVTKNKDMDLEYRPTLYDLLVGRAVNAFANSRTRINRPQDMFLIDSPEYFGTASDFIKLDITTSVTSSLEYVTVKLYQDWLRFRLADNNPTALMDADLNRLKFIRQESTLSDKDKEYEKALWGLFENTKNSSEAGDVLYEMAFLYKEQGESARDKESEYRLRLKEAVALCNRVIKEYPRIKSASYAKNMIKSIQAPGLRITMEGFSSPNKPTRALVEYKNTGKVHVSVYKLDINEFAKRDQSYEGRSLNAAKKAGDKVVTLPVTDDYQTYTTEIPVDALPAGFYLVKIQNKEDEKASDAIVQTCLFQVSNLSFVSFNNEGTVYNRITGEPVAGAAVKVYTTKDYNNPIKSLYKTFVTDKEGKVKPEIGSGIYPSATVVESGTDKIFLSDVYYYNYRNEPQDRINTVLFSDRAIYRPGQTVFFKGLMMRLTGATNEKEIIRKSPVQVTLLDVNRQEIARLDLKTNEYGTFNGSFVIPQGLLNGTMSIRAGENEYPIRVEEYKRPTFEVKIEAPKQETKLNDSVRIVGEAKALAGYAVDGAEVRFRIVRNAEIPYRYGGWFPRIPEQREIASGVLKTDESGRFTVRFFTAAEDVKNDKLIYNYVITADITDLNGETQSATYTLRASAAPVLISADIPAVIDLVKKNTEFDIKTVNLNGDTIACKVEGSISELQLPGRTFRDRLWQMPDTMIMSREEFEKLFPADSYREEDTNPERFNEKRTVGNFSLHTGRDKKIDLSLLNNASSGMYKIVLKAVTDKGITADATYYVKLINGTPQPVYRMNDWIETGNTKIEPGGEAEFWIAGGEKNSRVEYLLFDKTGKVIDKRIIRTEPVPSKLTIPVEQQHQGGLTAYFTLVQNNRLYSRSVNIEVPYTEKELNIRFASFRDKLLPGESEKWTLTIKDRKGDLALAELAATLYDASLDAFAVNSWATVFDAVHPQSFKYMNISSGNLNRVAWGRFAKSPSYSGVSPLVRNYPDMEPISFSRNIMIRGTGSLRRQKSLEAAPMAAVNQEAISDDKMVLEEAAVANYDAKADVSTGGGSESGNNTGLPVVIRSDFNETAFFYPELRTNEKGETVIEFTIPESLTRWKMLGLAQTEDLKIGSIERELITQKEVAVSANPPRFFRENDKIVFTAKINNITDNNIRGEAEFTFFDALTLKPIDIISGAGTVEFSVNPAQSTIVSKELSIPEGIQAITYRVTAKAGNHSDGEEKTVPVLSNTLLITESMPFMVRGNQEKKFTFERLKKNNSKTLRNHNLTLEFTSNPAWYAIQSLPYLMEYPYECSEQTFSRYYANTLASSVINSSPKIKQIFDLWRTLPDSKALLSNLEKNAELKQAVLEETPWVLESENETERKKRLGLLFDLNRMSNEQQRSVLKLQKAQNPDGSFPWFEGMPGNRYITQHILTGMVRLEKMTSLKEDRVNTMVKNGFEFLDRQIAKDYSEEMKRKNVKEEETRIASIQIHYLYACSFRNRQPANSDAYKFYMDRAALHWTKFGIYEQGMIALVMHRAGRQEIANKILISLKERAGKSEEMGMYWDNNRRGYFWYQAPIETQALLIEVFNEVSGDKQAVEEMKIWLLRNKQTNDWKTTKATTEATYALLMTGDNWLDSDASLDVKIGGVELDRVSVQPIRPEPGTGYVKTSWSGTAIKKEMADLEVKNPNHSIAWGALYWQYFEQSEKVTAAETNLKLQRELYIKTQTESGQQLVAVDKSKLRVGDLITVRTVLKADRDFEYVHLKDARAAGFEPVTTLSGYRSQGGIWYYQSMKDASVNFFIDRLPKGTYVFEYDLRVSHVGDFSTGISTIQCMYAPEFNAHSAGGKVVVE